MYSTRPTAAPGPAWVALSELRTDRSSSQKCNLQRKRPGLRNTGTCSCLETLPYLFTLLLPEYQCCRKLWSGSKTLNTNSSLYNQEIFNKIETQLEFSVKSWKWHYAYYAYNIQHVQSKTPTSACRAELDSNWLYLNISDYIWLYLIISDYTWLYLVLSYYTWFYLNISDYTWLYLYTI